MHWTRSVPDARTSAGRGRAQGATAAASGAAPPRGGQQGQCGQPAPPRATRAYRVAPSFGGTPRSATAVPASRGGLARRARVGVVGPPGGHALTDRGRRGPRALAARRARRRARVLRHTRGRARGSPIQPDRPAHRLVAQARTAGPIGRGQGVGAERRAHATVTRTTASAGPLTAPPTLLPRIDAGADMVMRWVPPDPAGRDFGQAGAV
nr:PhM00033.1 [Neoporphyra haitanensis]WOE55269.1 PhF00036.1 [Neoporphyra haitanensis]WOE55271.1 PhF00038.1 [Neoporphyra haitanensis]